MVWLKSCPRCSGDLHEENDMYGRYVACLQCGHYLTEAQEAGLSYTRHQVLLATSRKMVTAA